ncbi:MAG TPA: hypothetical protein VNQ80_12325 [Parapedobacter sp.]|uniref:hypothetical protein n=1 Tax=Parapedobacter sp. TaxID=1958893 RepID=UPI002C69EB5F|nr:hypothetical protein [Parapedobacter sp.]HWK58123.1 hypothetical protein [Parapedobacter sp.]
MSSYKVFTNPEDFRMIAIDENGDGYLFTPDDEYKRQFSPDRLIYNDLGDLYVGEELFGAEFDRNKLEAAFNAVNQYWRDQSSSDGFDVEF